MVFPGTLEEREAACAFSRYTQTPKTEPLLALIYSVPSLVPLVTDSWPWFSPVLAADYRRSCHAASWETG